MCKIITTRQGLLKQVVLIRLVVITSIVQTYKLRRGIGEVHDQWMVGGASLQGEDLRDRLRVG